VSLRLQIVALFTAVLATTLLVASGLGLRIAQRSIEAEVKDRTLALAQATARALGRTASDDDSITNEIAAIMRTHRGVLRAEVARFAALGIDSDFVEARFAADGGFNFARWRGPATGVRVSNSIILQTPELGHAVRVVWPYLDGRGLRARLTLVASLAESDRLAASERIPLLQVAVGASLFLVVAFWILLGRLLVRRVGSLADTMRAVEQGHLEVQAPGPSEGGDELAYLARGFNRMLAQIRGFNAELTHKIDDATAELRRKNEALAELNELLVAARRDLTAKERLAALGQLAGTIAHELGNPLNAVSGHVQLLSLRTDLDEKTRATVKIVNGEAQRMAAIIRRFLDQTRGFTPATEPVRLDNLVDEALDLTLGTETRARVQISRDVEPAASHVRTDPGLVRHLLTNLVTNAVDAMPAGGKLDVQARRDGKDLVLRVADTGSGMSPEVKRHIFEPFYTTKPSGKGTGLGLSICKEIARALKGRIDVESEQGRGSTFTVRFPADAVADGPHLAPAAS
jgi:signal transduction histidine kinase